MNWNYQGYVYSVRLEDGHRGRVPIAEELRWERQPGEEDIWIHYELYQCVVNGVVLSPPALTLDPSGRVDSPGAILTKGWSKPGAWEWIAGQDNSFVETQITA